MKQYFISKEQKQYRANLHCHSTLSDGKLTPEELKDAYRSKGYSILSITDHEHPKNHSDITDPDFLLLTGYEAYIRTDPNCSHTPYDPEIHLNLFAKDPENEAYICYNPPYCKYIKDPIELANLRRVGSERQREYTVEYINEFIRTAVENGYLVSYNHPVWSMEDEARILAYENCFSLEINNYSSYLGNHLEHSGALYDKMLRQGKRIFCHSGDDNHNKSHPIFHPRTDSFGAWTMIMAEDLTYSSVIKAMESGNMYASTGPQIHEISMEEGIVHVECSPADQIIMYMGGKKTRSVIADIDGTITGGDLDLDPESPYFRIAIIDKQGHIATSRGFFRSEYKQ